MILQTLAWWVWWGRREAKGRGRLAGVAAGAVDAGGDGDRPAGAVDAGPTSL